MQATILLVEDDEPTRVLIATALGRDGHKIIQAQDSTQAMEAWTEPGRKFDLLVTDVRLEEEDDGFVLARKLLDIHEDVPVIFISGDRDCFASPSMNYFGDSPFIAKPFDLGKLQAAVAKALKGKGPQK